MNEKQIEEILNRYKAGEATEQEKALLLSWSLNFRATAGEELSMEERVTDVDMIWTSLENNLALETTSTVTHERKFSLWPKLLAAAVVLAVLSFGTYFVINHSGSSAVNLNAANILPGINKATLTLSNGKKVVLDGSSKAQLFSEAGISVTKTKEGQLIYSAVPNEKEGNSDDVGDKESAVEANTSLYNVLETSKGQQYQVILPDGSHVWLNAASSLRYPVAFGKQERLVELSGEGYFEIVHNKKKPFKVKTADQQVVVLGTHFNVNAYPEDHVSKTTLLEGSVRIIAPALNRQEKGNVILVPGQESVLVGNQLQVQQADLEAAVAWRYGNFIFEGENIRSIMKKISRWYNVEVVYEGEVPEYRFGGTVSRFSKVTQVLRKLELTGKVHFTLEERRIIVTK